jgi:hypothetical protein
LAHSVATASFFQATSVDCEKIAGESMWVHAVSIRVMFIESLIISARIDTACTHIDSPAIFSQSTEVAWKKLAVATECAKRIQETCFEAMSEIIRSMILCAVATLVSTTKV